MQLKSIKTLTKQLSQEIIKNLNQHSENNRFITKHATFHDSPTESSLRYRQVLTQHRKCNPRFSVDSLRIFSYSSLQLSYSEWNYNIKDMKFASCGGNRGGWKEVDIELLKHVVGYTPTNAPFLFLVRSLFWCFCMRIYMPEYWVMGNYSLDILLCAKWCGSFHQPSRGARTMIRFSFWATVILGDGVERRSRCLDLQGGSRWDGRRGEMIWL